jgi:hypothetical protein
VFTPKPPNILITMDQSKLIKDIFVENENLAAHLRRASKQGSRLHILDVEVMTDKTKLIYEKLLQLQASLSKTDAVVETDQPESAPQAQPIEVVEQNVVEVPDTPQTELPTNIEHEAPVAEEAPPPDLSSNELPIEVPHEEVQKTESPSRQFVCIITCKKRFML